MKTIRVRSIRIVAIAGIASVCLVLILKSTVDTASWTSAAAPPSDLASDYSRLSRQKHVQSAWDAKDELQLKLAELQKQKPPVQVLPPGGEVPMADLAKAGNNPFPDALPPAMDVDESQIDGQKGPSLQRQQVDAFHDKQSFDSGGGDFKAGAGTSFLAKKLPAKSTFLRSEGYPLMKRGKFIPLARIVHFDLKGAAPKVPYFREYFRQIKEMGGTGLLMEWEDMFPFTGAVAKTNNGNAYSLQDIKTILGYAKEQGLDVIPLVQTFGHLEWILQFQEFRKYREMDRFMQTICPSNQDAVNMVKDLIDQVVAAHPGIRYFHMGADEAFQVGMCDKCQRAMQESGGSREQLMVAHIAAVASHVRDKHGLKVLCWHDMLNNVDNLLMEEYHLGELVEPVVWAYAESLDEYIMPDMWSRFATIFPYIWGASSYKGADGPTRWWSNVPHYLQNHISWISQMTRYHKEFRGEFRGLILTGWQRFDHFAVLCETLPVGWPSLAVNLLTIQTGVYDRNILRKASDFLGCSSPLDIDSPMAANFCKFPGAKVYSLTQQLRVLLQNVEEQVWGDYQIQGWLSAYAIARNFSSSWYLDQILDKLQMYFEDLRSLQTQLHGALSEVFFQDTADEWIFVYVEPHLNKLQEAMDAAKRISKIETFPRRPFDIRLRRKTPPANGNQQQQRYSGGDNGGVPKEILPDVPDVNKAL